MVCVILQPKKRIVITGGSGLLALNWAYAIRGEYDVHLFAHHNIPILSGVSCEQVSLENALELEQALNELTPDILVHTAGLTNVDECEHYPDRAELSNAVIADNVSRVCSRLHIKLVHISTDHLFSGEVPLVDENAIPNPLNEYAKTKLKAENFVQSQCDNFLIIRTNFYGWGYSSRRSFSDWIIQSLTAGDEIKVFSDVWFTPILIDHLVAAVHELVNKDLFGIYNIVGDDRLTKYDFVIKLANHFDLDPKLIKPISIEDINLSAIRPLDMSLSNKKVVMSLGRNMGGVDQGLRELRKQSDIGHEAEIMNAI